MPLQWDLFLRPRLLTLPSASITYRAESVMHGLALLGSGWLAWGIDDRQKWKTETMVGHGGEEIYEYLSVTLGSECALDLKIDTFVYTEKGEDA